MQIFKKDKQNLKKIQLTKVFCYIDLETNEVYSYRKKKLKPFINPRDHQLYYYLNYNGSKETSTLKKLLLLANLQNEVL